MEHLSDQLIEILRGNIEGWEPEGARAQTLISELLDFISDREEEAAARATE